MQYIFEGNMEDDKDSADIIQMACGKRAVESWRGVRLPFKMKK